ncbi:MAG: AAA family ATPase [Caulobacter sp.]|nr:AAA family ATPase [Caulobacter sp.]
MTLVSDLTGRGFVITGGPGAGKTTLVEALARTGVRVMPEAGRAVIQDQAAIDGPGRPQVDPMLFAELQLAHDLARHREAAVGEGPVVFDRGIVDVVGYLRLIGREPPPHLLRAAQRLRYDHRVLVAPPWAAIYANDPERTQDFAEAVATHAAVSAAYVEAGYDLVDLPLADVEARVRFVRERIGRLVDR